MAKKTKKFPKLKFGFYLFCAMFLGAFAPILGSASTQVSTEAELQRLQGEGSVVIVEQLMKFKDYASVGCLVLAIVAAIFAGQVVVDWYIKNHKN